MNDRLHVGLLIILFVCHWAADYTHMSTNKMLNAKRKGYPLWPIINHAIVHSGVMTSFMIIYMEVCGEFDIDTLLLCAGLQLSSHFIIDTLKGRANVWFPTLPNPGNREHWYVFGFDQLLHGLVIIWMWYLTLNIR